jgi:hypothetical protein
VHTSGPWTRTTEQARLRGAPSRQPCDLVTVPARQGLEAVDILRLHTAVGPVLHDRSAATLGFLVPRGTASRWDLPGSACVSAHDTGDDQRTRVGIVPPCGTRWLLPPHAAAPYTDPALLRAALGEAAVTIEAADRL